MGKIQYRNINIGVNVAEHTRRDDDEHSSNYRNSERNLHLKERRGNINNTILVIILFVLIYELYMPFQ